MKNTFRFGLLFALILLIPAQSVRAEGKGEAERLFELILQSDDHESNRAMLQEILDIDPDSAYGHFSKGWFWAEKENYRMAASEYQAALAIHPGLGEARNNLASAYFHLGRWTDSIREYEEVLRQHPDWSDTYLSLGCAYYRSKDSSASIQAWNRALELNPALFVAHYYLGLAHENLGRRSEARRHYRTFLEMDEGEEEFKKHVEHATERERKIRVEERRAKL